MTEPKKYKLRQGLSGFELTKAGFEPRGNLWKFTKSLYRFDDAPTEPYIFLMIWIENDKMVTEINCVGGNIYAPFYNPDLRYNNLVYEKVVRSYNNVMDILVKKKILNHIRKKKYNE